MTASLHETAYSSTLKQRSRLVLVAKKHGVGLDELRGMCGGSVRALSSDQASKMIQAFSGDPLPHPPGHKPSAYAGKKVGAQRIITQDHVEQITRLGLQYFTYHITFNKWLWENFRVKTPHDLATASRAGDVIRVLKDMHARKAAKTRETRPDGRSVCVSVCVPLLVSSALLFLSCSTPSPVQTLPTLQSEIANRQSAISNPVGVRAAPTSRPATAGDDVRVYVCFNRIGDDGLNVRNAGGFSVNFVFDEANCHDPRVFDPRPSRPKPRAFFDPLKEWLLDWSGSFVYGDVAPLGGNGIVDVDDIELVLNNFIAGTNRPAAVDLEPCGGGDGVIDIGDIEAVLYAFQGYPRCP